MRLQVPNPMQGLKHLAHDTPGRARAARQVIPPNAVCFFTDEATLSEPTKEFEHDARAQGSPGNYPGMDGPSGRKPAARRASRVVRDESDGAGRFHRQSPPTDHAMAAVPRRQVLKPERNNQMSSKWGNGGPGGPGGPWGGGKPGSEIDNIVQLGQDGLKRLMPSGGPRCAIALAILALVGLGVWTAYFTVPSDSVAVVQRFGKYLREVPPGLHFKLPLGIDVATTVPVKRQLKQEFGFATAGAADPYQTPRNRVT